LITIDGKRKLATREEDRREGTGWEVNIIIVVEKDAKDSKLWKIHAEQLEYPGR